MSIISKAVEVNVELTEDFSEMKNIDNNKGDLRDTSRNIKTWNRI